MSKTVQNIDKYISVSQVIEHAREAGYDFGKGDPVNRLRYYIKLGMLPHMQRRQAGPSLAYTEGFLPLYSIVLLLKAQDLKKQGRTTDEVRELVKDELARYRRSELMAKFEDYEKPSVPLYSTLLMFVGIVFLFSLYNNYNASITYSNSSSKQAVSDTELVGEPLAFYPHKAVAIPEGDLNDITTASNNTLPAVAGLFISLEGKPGTNAGADVEYGIDKQIYRCVK